MSRVTPIILLLMASSAWAEKLVIAPFTAGDGATEKSAAAFSALVSEEARKESSLSLVQRGGTGKASPARKGLAPDVQASLDEGSRAYDDLRFDEAVPALKRGVTAMLADPANIDFDVLAASHIKLAAAAFRMGEEREAKATLFELARLAPGATLPLGFPPVFVKEFDKAKKRVEKQAKAKVSIEGPAGATASLDGRDLGMVPIHGEVTTVGVHYVKVDGGKGQLFGQAVDLSGTAVVVKASFGSAAPVAELLTPPVLDQEFAARTLAYGRSAGADFVLVGLVVRKSEAQLMCASALYSVKRQGFMVLTPVAFDVDVVTANTEAFKLADELGDKAAASSAFESLPAVLVQVSSEPTIVGPHRKPVLVPRDSPVSISDAPAPSEPQVKAGVPAWVWIVAGVAVVGAGVGGYFGVREATKPVTGRVTASW